MLAEYKQKNCYVTFANSSDFTPRTPILTEVLAEMFNKFGLLILIIIDLKFMLADNKRIIVLFFACGSAVAQFTVQDLQLIGKFYQ